MKKTILAFFLLSVFSAYAQTDTIPLHELNEVTIVASSQHAKPDKTVYVPTSRQRETADGGMALLSQMGIPQLQVNPMSESVKTASNEAVAVFINYQPATKEEVAALNPANVRRVEYLDFPIDPRFMRAQHAVNFIVSKYASGGYTKLSGKERFLVNSGEGMVYSKYQHRAMEYDLCFQGKYAKSRHFGEEAVELFRLPDGVFTREESVSDSELRRTDWYGAFQALWSRGEMTWRNKIEAIIADAPVQRQSGSIAIMSPAGNNITDYSTSSPWRYNTYSFTSQFQKSFKTGWSLNSNLSFDLSHNRSEEVYATDLTTISNNALENSWYMRDDTQLNKQFNSPITGFASLSAGGGITSVHYTGDTDARNRFGQFFGGITIGAAFNLGKISGSIDGGVAYEIMDINDSKMTDPYPFTHISLQYAPNAKNTFGIWAQYASFTPSASMKSPNLLRQNELLYISGNPGLKISRNTVLSLNYTWLPSNQFQLTAYASYFGIANRQAAVYTPDGPDGTMLKKYQNNGNYNHGQLGANFTCKFFEGKLSATFSPRLLMYDVTGDNAISHYPLTASVNTNYYLGQFFFNAYWGSRNSYVDGERCYLTKIPSHYSLSAGWAHRGWNIQLRAANLLRNSWCEYTESLSTRWYDGNKTSFGSQAHRNITLSVAYTFNYGKKVTASQEIEQSGMGSSAILK